MSHDRPTSTPRTIGFPKARPSVGDHPRSANGERTSAARLGRSLQAASNASQARHRPTTDHAPKVTRPKGRVFISFVILSVVGTVASGLWNEFFRFQAYGTIEGRVVKISAPWAGIVESLHVKDGQYVQPGELLATLQNTELKLRLGKLRDEILLAHAAFESRVAELKATHREDAERILRVHVDYFELVSQYQSDKSKLDALRSDYRRLSLLGPDGVIAAGEIESARFALEGQAARVAELKSAVDRMQQGLGDATLMEGPHKLLSLEKSRLATLISEWQRLVDFEQLGEIRCADRRSHCPAPLFHRRVRTVRHGHFRSPGGRLPPRRALHAPAEGRIALSRRFDFTEPTSAKEQPYIPRGAAWRANGPRATQPQAVLPSRCSAGQSRCRTVG